MSTLWLIIWAGLSIFILGVFVWTTKALHVQKAVWKRFAAARGLSYRSGKFLEAATLSGTIGGFELYLTSEERDMPDIRGRKFVTMIQFGRSGVFPGTAAVGSGDYKILVQNLGARDTLPDVVTALGGGDMALSASDDAAKMTAFFTPERVRVIDALMKQPRVSVLFLCDETQGFVRLETVDPFLKPGQLDKLVDKLIPLILPLWP